jgi:hypothetical protein
MFAAISGIEIRTSLTTRRKGLRGFTNETHAILNLGVTRKKPGLLAAPGMDPPEMQRSRAGRVRTPSLGRIEQFLGYLDRFEPQLVKLV